MEKIEKACSIAVAIQKEAFGSDAVETEIKRIRETDEVFLFDFKRKNKETLIGGGGLLVYKKDMSSTHYCIPSWPENILEIIQIATEVDVPKEYQ